MVCLVCLYASSKGVTVMGRRRSDRQRDAKRLAAHTRGGVFLPLSHARRVLRGQLLGTLERWVGDQLARAELTCPCISNSQQRRKVTPNQRVSRNAGTCMSIGLRCATGGPSGASVAPGIAIGPLRCQSRKLTQSGHLGGPVKGNLDTEAHDLKATHFQICRRGAKGGYKRGSSRVQLRARRSSVGTRARPCGAIFFRNARIRCRLLSGWKSDGITRSLPRHHLSSWRRAAGYCQQLGSSPGD